MFGFKSVILTAIYVASLNIFLAWVFSVVRAFTSLNFIKIIHRKCSNEQITENHNHSLYLFAEEITAM